MSSGAPARTSPARARAVCTHAPSRSSISAESPIGSSRRDRWPRSRHSPGAPLDISDFPTRHPYGLGLWQNHIERILAGWVGELAVPIYRGREVTGFAQDDTGVDVELSDGQSLRAEYLVGCDGGRSLVRKAAGIEFPGWDPTTSALIAEAEMAEEPELGIRHDALGIHAIGRVEYEIRDGEVVYMDERAGTGHGDRSRTSDPRPNPPCAISARRSSPSTGPITGSTVPPGSPGSPIRLGRPRPTATDGSCWPATPRTCMPRTVGRASTPACRMR